MFVECQEYVGDVYSIKCLGNIECKAREIFNLCQQGRDSVCRYIGRYTRAPGKLGVCPEEVLFDSSLHCFLKEFSHGAEEAYRPEVTWRLFGNGLDYGLFPYLGKDV